ncbi:MAG: anti-sigma regulatory factor [Lachnospiraceae bacterium]|nr:anti-sigma regulatory factor [Lachnospiraceae bacterium]
MSEPLVFHFEVDGSDFTSAGTASVTVKKNLRQLGLPSEVIRKLSIAMYEGEINMVIHAEGGTADVIVTEEYIDIILKDQGPGIPDVDLAMQEGYSTATAQIHSLGFGAGMGLPNMKRYSDEMKIDTVLGVGTTVSMRIYIR